MKKILISLAALVVLSVTAILGWALLLPQYFPFEMLIKTFFWFL